MQILSLLAFMLGIHSISSAADLDAQVAAQVSDQQGLSLARVSGVKLDKSASGLPMIVVDIKGSVDVPRSSAKSLAAKVGVVDSRKSKDGADELVLSVEMASMNLRDDLYVWDGATALGLFSKDFSTRLNIEIGLPELPRRYVLVMNTTLGGEVRTSIFYDGAKVVIEKP